MEAKELLSHAPEALDKMAGELRAKIRDLRFNVGTGGRSNVNALRSAKHDLARVLTVRNRPNV